MSKTNDPILDPEILAALAEVIDPEIGLSIVDLGLIYRALWNRDGIELSLTLTTRSCPLGELILDDAREALATRFGPAVPISAEMVWDPPWTPDRISEQGRQLLRG